MAVILSRPTNADEHLFVKIYINMLTKGIIKRNLKTNIFKTEDIRRAFEKSKRKFLSTVWNKFFAILDQNKEVISSHVCCKYCNEVFKISVGRVKGEYNSSNLQSHLMLCQDKLREISKKKERNGP